MSTAGEVEQRRGREPDGRKGKEERKEKERGGGNRRGDRGLGGLKKRRSRGEMVIIGER